MPTDSKQRAYFRCDGSCPIENWRKKAVQGQLILVDNSQPISVISVSLFVGTGVGLYFYFQYEKARMERKRITEASKGMGKPKVGGAFELLDQDGKPWSSNKMKGKFALVCLAHLG